VIGVLQLTLRNVWAHKRRLVGMFVAVCLSVAFLGGTLVLGDTMRANFDRLFADVNSGTDVVLRSSTSIGDDIDAPRGLVDESLAADARTWDGVAAAEPLVDGVGLPMGSDGEVIGGGGPPSLAGNWVDNPALNPYRLVEGRAPTGPGEVVINRGAAEAGDLAIGDRTVVRVPDAVEVTIVGISTFGELDSLAGITFTAFTLDEAQRLITSQPGKVSRVALQATDGVSEDELLARVRARLPGGVDAITGTQLTRDNQAAIRSDFLDLLTTFLAVFGVVALLVATFSIFNTMAILVAQRTREAALLRAVGAARAQILGATMAEALVIGVVGSAAGLVAGMGIAALLKALFAALGFSLPTGGLVLKANVAIVCMVVGVAATAIAGLAPAIRASRIRPVAALRAVAAEPASLSRGRVAAGAVVMGIGVTVVLSAVLGSGDAALSLAALGALIMIVGVVVFGPVVARPAADILGWPLPRLRGITGELARENARRGPRRMSTTASALMVGVGVVTLFTVFAASLKQSIDDNVSASFAGDLAVTMPWGTPGLSPRLATDVAALPEVEQAVGIGAGQVLVDSGREFINVADPAALADLLALDMVDGSLGALTPTQVAISEDEAEDRNLEIGSPVTVTFVDGTTTELVVGAIYEASNIVGGHVMPRATWAPHAVQDVDAAVFADLRDGVDLDSGRAAMQRVADAHSAPDVLDRDQYVAELAVGVDMMLSVVYVLLALSIIIALMGIANALALAIHERTREIGLLRAVGTTRRQLRSVVRGESVVISVFGTLGGIGVGLFLGWALVEAASGDFAVTSFAVPAGPLVAVLVAGAIAGVLAAVRPARRAARLDVLAAIATR
jgi:putative ABC transport system permease protein